MTRKVYSYMRFSTPEQSKGHSLQRQADYAAQYVLKNGLILDKSLTMKDEGLSAYHQKHITKGALGVFYRAVEEGMIDRGSILIVENIDRLSRASPRNALPQFLSIINAGITVVIAKDGREYSQESLDKNPYQLFENLGEMMRANKESEYKSIRVKASIVSQIKQWIEHGHGKIVRNARDPYWLKAKPDKTGFDIIPDRVDIVIEIANMYRKGWGYQKIQNYLNENRTPFNGKNWYLAYLCKLLNNRAIIGERSFTINGETYIIKNYYPKLMNETDFSILQNDISNRAPTKSQQSIPSIITGNKISFCGHCGSTLCAQNHKPRSRNGKTYDMTSGLRRIRCTSRTNGVECLATGINSGSIAVSVSALPIERSVLEYCSDQMELSAILNDDNDKSISIKASIGEIQRQACEAEQKVKKGHESIEALLIQGETISPVINRVVETARVEHESLLKKIQALGDELRFQKVHKSADLIDQWQSVKNDIHNLDEEARLLVRQVVKKTFKRIDIYFHSFHKSNAPIQLKNAIHDDDNAIVIILTFTNDKTRILSIDRKTGSWIKGGDIEINAESVLSALAARHVADS